ncbi:MAG: EAL domain-containing protein [Actinomycetota bacterium]|nr:EAL domain-containing protein [Actinomycetota bacterium]
MRTRLWLALLLMSVTVEIAFSLVLRLDALGRASAHGSPSATVLAGVGLAWLPVLLLSAVGLAVSLVAERRWPVAESGPGPLGSGHRATERDPGASAADVAVPEWLWATDEQLRLTYSNRQVVELIGWPALELFGRSMLTLLADGETVAAGAAAARARRTGEGWQDLQLSWRHRDGRTIRLVGNASVLQDDARAVIGFRGSWRPAHAGRRSDRRAVEGQPAGPSVGDRIAQVVRNEAVRVALQPIVNLYDGRLAGAEALARFADGRSPDTWFTEARDAGQSVSLDLLTFRLALATLPALPPGAYLSVNATPELIADPALAALLGPGFAVDRIVLEVTEHVAIASYEAITAALAPLKERGMRIAVDDAGAGYASFNHVLQLRPDIIKIDRSLIAKVTSDPARRSLVTAFVLLALDLDATVIAEGVETPSELETVASLGVDWVQGYLLGRPTTDAADWEGWPARDWLAARPRPPVVTLP